MAIVGGIVSEQKLLVGWISDRITIDDVRAVIARFAVHPESVRTWDRLAFVADDTDLSQFDLASLVAVKDQMVESYFGGRLPEPSAAPAYRIAIVSRDTANAGIASLFRSVWDTSGPAPVGLRLFHDPAAALAWLGREPMTEAALRAGTQFL